jgi:hypothetical protein
MTSNLRVTETRIPYTASVDEAKMEIDMRKVALLLIEIIVAIGCGSSLEGQTVESV